MGKQSARLYYQGKDHKDIYYNGMYHNAMIFNGEVVWRKLRDEKHYVVNTSYFESSAQSWTYQEAILYPAKRVMHIHDNLFDMMYFTHNNKMVFGNYTKTPVYLNSNRVITSFDAKIYQKVLLSSYISGATVPVCDGFMYVRNGDYRTAFIKINRDGTYEEHEIANSDQLHPSGAYIGGECPNGVFVSKNGIAVLKTDGTRSPSLSEVSSNVFGYGNGMYVLLQTIWEYDYIYNVYAWTIRDNHTWRRCATPIAFSRSYKMLNMLYRDRKFIIYLLAQPNAGESERLRIYETEDFKKYKEIPVSAKKLSIKFINSGYRYSHIDLLLDSSAPNEEGHYRCTSFSISNNAFFKDQKKMDSDGLVLFILGSASERIYTTVFIDNLYFEESEKNFAIHGVHDIGDIREVL